MPVGKFGSETLATGHTRRSPVAVFSDAGSIPAASTIAMNSNRIPVRKVIPVPSRWSRDLFLKGQGDTTRQPNRGLNIPGEHYQFQKYELFLSISK